MDNQELNNKIIETKNNIKKLLENSLEYKKININCFLDYLFAEIVKREKYIVIPFYDSEYETILHFANTIKSQILNSIILKNIDFQLVGKAKKLGLQVLVIYNEEE